MDGICPHLFGDRPVAECSICVHGVEVTRPKKPQKVKPPTTAMVDPVLAKIEAIHSGFWCADCDSPRDSHGFCAHERLERFNAERHQVLSWASGFPESKEVKFLASQGIRRSVLRAGIRDLPVMGQPGITAERAIATQTRALLDIAPKWNQPRNSVADDLPL